MTEIEKLERIPLFLRLSQTAYDDRYIFGFLKQPDRRYACRTCGKTRMSIFNTDAADREHWNAHRAAHLAESLDSLRRAEFCF